jgi:hypothetical protein
MTASLSGELFLFNPSSTTYVKHFIARMLNNGYRHHASGPTIIFYTAGYFNTTSVINAVKFQMSCWQHRKQAQLKLYGIKGD